MICDFCHLPLPQRRHVEGGPAYCCFGCKLAADITRSRGEAGQVNWMLTRLGVSVFLSMIVMMFSMYLYRQHFVDASEATTVSIQLSGVMRYLCLIFSAPVFVMLGFPVLEAAADDLKRKRISTDALVVLGVAAALVISYVSTLRDFGPVYYETACIVLVFLTLGRWLEANGKLKSSAAIRGLESLLPDQVSVERDGQSMMMSPQEVLVGDILTIRAGERISADAEIETGRAAVDESMLTGESLPIVRQRGDLIRAGTLNVDGLLRARAVSVGTESTLGRLVKLLEAAKSSRTHWERLTDRLSQLFIPLMLALAGAGFVLGWLGGGVSEAILRSLSVMLIACPCALGIATPMAVWVALGSAAKRGLLYRTGHVLETLARVRTVCFDKTGTLTDSSPSVQAFTVSENSLLEEASGVAAAMATVSRHAFADAVLKWAMPQGVCPARVEEVRCVPGRGVVGSYQGIEAAFGSPVLMRERNFEFDEPLQAQLNRAQQAGNSLACIGWGDRVRGVFEFVETLRPQASIAVRELQAQGMHVLVLTGDHDIRARMIGNELGAKVLGGLSPEQKVAHIQAARHKGGVAMVGDGLNDAPALAAADVGVAMGCGADLTRDCASLCLLGNDPSDVVWALELARRTVRVIKLNLFWAFIYNMIGVALALTGRLNPIFAAGAMIISSLMVVTNSLRLESRTAQSAERLPPIPRQSSALPELAA